MKVFGKTPINLDGTVFEFKTVVSALTQRNFFIKENLRRAVDFGTIFMVDETLLPLPQEFVELIEECCSAPDCPLFSAPIGWRMPHVLRALGAFSSASAASKNGWDKDVPEGYSEHPVRIANVKGVICIHKITSENPWFKEVTDDAV